MSRTVGDRFELLGEAARGGMGSVFRGRDRRTGQTVAIKVLGMSSTFDHMRFERECSLLASLHHPNIVGYVAHGTSHDGVRYLVQEWVDGITLSTQLRTLGLTARDAIQVTIGVAEALGAAHALGIVHRDVKPANIILDGGEVERIKLVDFGIARSQLDSGVLTRTGIVVGTPSYMAPEQARGSIEITPATDVWALGCVLYEALSGNKPFEGRSGEAIRAKVLLHHPSPLRAVVGGLPEELSDYLQTMLAKVIGDRPPDGTHVAATLRALLPAVPAGRLRKTEPIAAQPTRATPSRKTPRAERCFMLVSLPPPEEDTAPKAVNLARISERHQLTMHPLEDGSMLLEGQADASVAYAALEIQAEIDDGAVSLFAQGTDEPLDEALERGADNLGEATMISVFAEAIDAEPVIQLDDVIADMLDRQGVALVATEHGRALPAPKARTR